MAHYQKFNKAATGHMFKHYERAKDENGEYCKFSNQNIDPDQTPLNYNLAPDHPEGQGGFIRKRCSEVKCLNRKDVNVMCSWIVTIPQTLQEQDFKRFFRATYDFLTKRYGLENVVSAYVHMDEVTPHLHFAFIPVVEGKNRKGESILKVSANDLITRMELQRFHLELEGHLDQTFGHEVGILNEATKNGNKSVLELKRQDMLNEIKKYQETSQKCVLEGLEMQGLLNNVNEKIRAKNAEFLEISANVDALKDEKNHLNAQIGDLSKEKFDLKSENRSLKSENLGLVKENEQLTIDQEQYNAVLRKSVENMDKAVSDWLSCFKDFDLYRSEMPDFEGLDDDGGFDYSR